MKKSNIAQSFRANPPAFALAVLAALSAVLLLAIGVRYAVNRMTLSGAERFLARPESALVLETVRFSRYLVQASPAGADPRFFRAAVYHARGEASVVCDLRRAAIDERRTDWLNRVLVLRTDWRSADTAFPSSVQVSLDPADITLIEKIEPRGYSAQDIEQASKAVAVGTATLGAAAGAGLGGAAGSALGSLASPLPRVLRLPSASRTLGALAGAAAGGAAGGAISARAGFLATGAFMAALSSTGEELDSPVLLASAARPLIALEILGAPGRESAASVSERWEADARERYAALAERRIREIGLSLGWNDVLFLEGGPR